MQSIVTADDAGLFAPCLGCERVWKRHGGRLELALGTTVISGEH
jgi:hypothetical protein